MLSPLCYRSLSIYHVLGAGPGPLYTFPLLSLVFLQESHVPGFITQETVHQRDEITCRRSWLVNVNIQIPLGSLLSPKVICLCRHVFCFIPLAPSRIPIPSFLDLPASCSSGLCSGHREKEEGDKRRWWLPAAASNKIDPHLQRHQGWLPSNNLLPPQPAPPHPNPPCRPQCP